MHNLKSKALQNLRKYVMVTAIKCHSPFFLQTCNSQFMKLDIDSKALKQNFLENWPQRKNFFKILWAAVLGPYSRERFVDMPRKFLCLLVFSPVLFITTGSFGPATPRVSL